MSSLLPKLLRRPQQQYDRLSLESEDSDEFKTLSSSPDDLPEEGAQANSESSFHAVFYLTLLCIVCTLANLIVLRVIEFKAANPPQLKNLRRPSQFPGLERVERPVPPIERSIVNFPFVVARVDKNHPRKVVPNNAPNGIANGNRVKVTNEISTVLQFRTLDWGMESCTLTLRLPGQETIVDNIRSNDTASLVLGPTHNHIYIHKLVSASNNPISEVLNARTLTYASQPALGEKIASLHLDYGFEWTHTFPCAMDSLHAFALVAADDSTHMEWWQDRQALLPAVYFEQHATK